MGSNWIKNAVLAEVRREGFTEEEILAAATRLENKGVEHPYTVKQLIYEIEARKLHMQSSKVYESRMGKLLRLLSERGVKGWRKESLELGPGCRVFTLEDCLLYHSGGNLELAKVLKEIAISERKKKEENG